MGLKTYHSKRNFKVTSEPKGKKSVSDKTKNAKNQKPAKPYLYVIQKHAASHLHYDLRLEMNGVLKSWAIPKGPHLNPSIKRLAVEVEDHPIEYGSFEGTIPQGEYGGGTVMLWDTGEWLPEADAFNAYQKGDLTFQIKGKKLKGLWKLIRIKNFNSSNKKHWLFFKVVDKEAKDDYDIVTAKPLSVLTKQNMEEIAHNNTSPHKKNTSKKNKADNKDPSPTKTVKKKEKFELSSLSKVKGAIKARVPVEISPQLCFLSKEVPEGENWLHEVKFDGYRIIAKIKNQKITLTTRNGLDWSSNFPGILTALEALSDKDLILDGELVALDKKGISHFQSLQNSLKQNDTNNLIYYVFDLPFFDGYDLTKVALVERKRILKNYLQRKNAYPNTIRYSEHVHGKGDIVYKKACKMKLEGIVSKEMNSSYEERRSRNWLKSKCSLRQEFVIGGFTPPQGARYGFGSLLIGLYNKGKQLIYHGHVGTGFDNKLLESLYKQLIALKQDQNPFHNLTDRSIIRNVTWVKPKLVGEIEYTEMTEEGILRHPSFIGLRLDKPAKDVKGEQMVINTNGKKKHDKANKTASQTKNNKIERPGKTKTANSPPKKILSVVKANDKEDEISIAGIKLSHATKIAAVTKNVTKLELAQYYQKVAPKILPFVINRPLSLVRCPSIQSNTKNPCFFHKHYSKSFPEGIFPIPIKEEGGKTEDYVMIKAMQGLIALVQFNVIEIHPWGSQKANLEKPDQVIFDLDPGPSVTWQDIIDAAFLIRDELKKIKLTAFVKTSGGKGLHIVLPIKPKGDWEQVKNFAATFSRYLAEKYPKQFTATISKSKRKGKIFVDYLRNGRGATAVAAYSTRAKEGAPISTPITWQELPKIEASNQFKIRNIWQRLDKLKKDPWDGFFKSKQNLPIKF